MSRYPALQGKRDANEPSIIAALEAAGATVSQIATGKGVPDLLVGADMPCPHCGFMFPQNKLEEVKTEHGKLNAKQRKFFRLHKGQADVVRTPQEALAVIGVLHAVPGTDIDSKCRRAGL